MTSAAATGRTSSRWPTGATKPSCGRPSPDEESVYRMLKLHVNDDSEVRGVISAVNEAVELRSFREIIPSMNDIFIRAVNGKL